MVAIIESRPPQANAITLPRPYAPAVTPLFTDPRRAAHERASVDCMGRRLARLFGQPALIAAALWAAGIPERAQGGRS